MSASSDPFIVRRTLALGTAGFLLSISSICAQSPAWWAARGVTATNAPRDYAPANQGQLKWLATQAAAEFEAKLPGGAGTTVRELVRGFTQTANYAPVNVGQLKAAVQPFYDRLAAWHLTNGYPTQAGYPYPWSASTNVANDYAPANLGQVKYLFSFNLAWLAASPDADGDGLSDAFEAALGTNPLSWDTDGDRLSDRAELAEHGTNPANSDSDTDGAGDGEEFLANMNPRMPDEIVQVNAGDATLEYRSLSSSRSKEFGFPAFESTDPPVYYLKRTEEFLWSDFSLWRDLGGRVAWAVAMSTQYQGVEERDSLTLARRGRWSYDDRYREWFEAGPGFDAYEYWYSCHAESAWTNRDATESCWYASTSSPDGAAHPTSPNTVSMKDLGQEPGNYDPGAVLDLGPDHRYSTLITGDSDQYRTVAYTDQVKRTCSAPYTTARLKSEVEAFAQTGAVWSIRPPWGLAYVYPGTNAYNVPLTNAAESSASRHFTTNEVSYALRATQCRIRVPNARTGATYRVSLALFFNPDDGTQTNVLMHTTNLVARCTDIATTNAFYIAETGFPILPPASNGTVFVRLISGSILPDFNRDGAIDETDRTRLLAKGCFRFWINDDRDIGDDSTEAQDDSPPGSYEDCPWSVAAREDNWKDGRVNGWRDVVDLFPIRLDLPIGQFPPAEYAYQLRQAEGAIKFVYTSLTPGSVGRIHTEKVLHCGVNSDTSLDVAPVHGVPASSMSIPWPRLPGSSTGTLDPDWLGQHNVLLLEGTRFSTNPLILDITKNSNVVYSCQMPLSVSPVKDMFRYLNIRTNDVLFTEAEGPCINDRESKVGKWGTSLAPPGNYPDGFFDAPGTTLKTLVSIHGLDWDHEESPGGNSEIFKRFFQSGCNARFVGVSWAADCGRRLGMPVIYYTDVIGAFVAAHYIKEGLTNYWGPDTSIFAHSLGNVVASSMLADHGVDVGNYFLINAAVPIEAYDGGLELDRCMEMTPPEWKTNLTVLTSTNIFPLAQMSARWHTLFSNGDPRSRLGWDDRFGVLATRTNVYNFFSSGEEILRQPDGVIPALGIPTTLLVDAINWLPLIEWRRARDTVRDGERIWVYGEMTKGAPAFLADFFFLAHVHAGWGFRDSTHATTNPILRPIFSPFQSTDHRCPLWDPAEAWLYASNGAAVVRERLPQLPFTLEPNVAIRLNKIKNHAKLLAEAIASLSGPTGGHILNHVNSTDMNATCRTTALWPVRKEAPKKNRWLHGDYKNPAFLYVQSLYTNCTAILKEGTNP